MDQYLNNVYDGRETNLKASMIEALLEMERLGGTPSILLYLLSYSYIYVFCPILALQRPLSKTGQATARDGGPTRWPPAQVLSLV